MQQGSWQCLSFCFAGFYWCISFKKLLYFNAEPQHIDSLSRHMLYWFKSFMSWRLTQSGECFSSPAINNIWVIPAGPLLTLRLLSLYLLQSGKRSRSNMFLFSCCYSSVCRSVVDWWVFNLSSKWSCSSAGNCDLKVETKAFESITTQSYDVRRGKCKQMEERLKILTSNSLSWNTCMLVNCSYTTVPSQTNWCWAWCILKYIHQ